MYLYLKIIINYRFSSLIDINIVNNNKLSGTFYDLTLPMHVIDKLLCHYNTIYLGAGRKFNFTVIAIRCAQRNIF